VAGACVVLLAALLSRLAAGHTPSLHADGAGGAGVVDATAAVAALAGALAIAAALAAPRQAVVDTGVGGVGG
jgi:hypothetical protein